MRLLGCQVMDVTWAVGWGGMSTSSHSLPWGQKRYVYKNILSMLQVCYIFMYFVDKGKIILFISHSFSSTHTYSYANSLSLSHPHSLTHTHTHTHTHSHTCTHTGTHTYSHSHIYTHPHAHTHSHSWVILSKRSVS